MGIRSAARSIRAFCRTRIRLWRNRSKPHRRLEIGPGPSRLPGFETLNIVASRQTDYVWDAATRLPFPDGTFEFIYASHVLEHIPWFQTIDVLREWMRVLDVGGTVEVWVPDGLKICAALVDYELHGKDYIAEDGWYRFNPEKDPCKWAAGRIFTYGDGTANPCSPNWHRALFTPRYLTKVFSEAGLQEVRILPPGTVRGYDHGWINLGVTGTKR